MRPDFYRADGDWTPLRLGRVGWFLAGAGFPHEFQGVEDAELPFFKVADTNLPGNEQELRSAPNTVSRLTARQLGARICPAGAIAFPKVGATLLGNKRRLTIGNCIFDNNMMALVPRAEHDPRFLLYALGDLDFGQLSNPGPVPSINAGDLKDVFLPIPAPRIQRSIASFLDRKTTTIDALIHKKERLVELLQEKRQALVTQAVTKGLSPNVTLKESGIPWIGKVPSNWKIVAVKRTAKPGRKTFTDGDWIESPFITEEGVRLIQTGNVGIGRYKEQGFRYVSDRTFHELRCTEVDPGDVLICRLDGPVGRACLAPNLGVRMITSVDNAILKPRADCDGRFLVYVLSSPKYLDWVQVLCRVGGGFRFRVSRSMLGDIQIPVPPADEQRRIADLLDAQTERMSALEQKLELHCERLREYRQALITAAVTGKIDVSQEAA
ncbi:MAG: restriction endonuclease subunit S [Pseudomonadota bacterium]